MTTHHLNSSRTAVVSNQTHWQPIDADTPRGAKMLLINRHQSGVATIGALGTGIPWFTHWAPLPRFEEPNHATA